VKKIVSPGLSLLLSLTLILSPTRAQQTISCDSTLMLLVLLAKIHYSYESSFELTNFAFGQLQPLFDQVASGQEPQEQGSGETAGNGANEQAGAESGTSGAGEVSLDLSGASLAPGNIEGEPTECTQLRTEVETYLLGHLQNTPLGGNQPTEEPAPTEQATQEATAETSG
jgi:hypothetical protein